MAERKPSSRRLDTPWRCRVPLPWQEEGPSYGFGPGGGWLPQPKGWGEYSAAPQSGDPRSFLELYRTALRLRRDVRGSGELEWLPAGEGGLAFRRGGAFECRVNLGDRPLPLPAGASLPVASDSPEGGGVLAPDTAVWIKPSA
ncbi:DUF3459 domain-containing protein [Streptomyces ovatisporus]|uniref:DUF3459 domain-containing protein n=1 Tax=Streptomyces ovatisporus TaxID=1128682 RepID=A0ABV9AAE9_9ACTN